MPDGIYLGGRPAAAFLLAAGFLAIATFLLPFGL